jgi:DNA ligase 1
LRFPLLASAKMDGIRCLMGYGKALSRTMIPIPNKSIQDWAASNSEVLFGLDGELIVGSPCASDTYRVTNSGVMSFDGTPDFTFHAFDLWNSNKGFSHRLEKLQDLDISISNFSVVPYAHIENVEDLLEYEDVVLERGYEGIVVRSLDGVYKNGRVTSKESSFIKIKRFTDMEAEIIGTSVRMHNENTLEFSNTGYAKRSTSKGLLTATDQLGAFTVKGLNEEFEGSVFDVGSGFDKKESKLFLSNSSELIGKVIKVRYFGKGVKNLPRHPVFLGFRDRMDF